VQSVNLRFLGKRGGFLLGVSCLCAGLVSGCAGPGEFVWIQDVPAAGAVGSSQPEYTIAPGDVLTVRVYDQESLSTKAKIRSDGRFTLPLVGDVVASGKRPVDLGKELEGRLKEFVVSPKVSVQVEESSPISVIVVGEVSKAGVVTVEPNASLLQVLALAGGPNEDADKSRIFILRRHTNPRRIRVTYDQLIRNDEKANRFSLRSGDVIVVE
jgi:polysaccharide export outer membrane protein